MPAIAFVHWLIVILVVVGISGINEKISAATEDSETLRSLDRRADGSSVLSLIIHDQPRGMPQVTLLDERSRVRSLSEYQGKVTMLHFWAIWCPPCRDELPKIDALQKVLGKDLLVIPISVDRGGINHVRAYYQSHSIVNLPVLIDEKMATARALKVNGIPYSIILNRDGMEVARVLGDRDWNDPDVVALMRYLVERR